MPVKPSADKRALPLSLVGWVCRSCWQTGGSTDRSPALQEHRNIHDRQQKLRASFEYRTCDQPDVVLRTELTRVEFEGLIGTRRPLDLDAGNPITIR